MNFFEAMCNVYHIVKNHLHAIQQITNLLTKIDEGTLIGLRFFVNFVLVNLIEINSFRQNWDYSSSIKNLLG